MKIVQKINITDIDTIADQIFTLICNEKSLTHRNHSEILDSLKQGNYHLAMKGNKDVLGFVCRNKLISDYYEIKSWYIKPQYRHKGIGKMVMDSALSGIGAIYLSSTFHPAIRDTLKKYGFRDLSLRDLPLKVVLKYLLSRKYMSILRHIIIRKSYLLIKS